jgi:hypothetical protein
MAINKHGWIFFNVRLYLFTAEIKIEISIYLY